MYLAFLNIIPYIDLVGSISGYISSLIKLKKEKTSKGISVIKQIIEIILLILWYYTDLNIVR